VQHAKRNLHPAVVEEVRVGEGDGELVVSSRTVEPKKNGRLPSNSSSRQDR
jgi:hypothetical protein